MSPQFALQLYALASAALSLIAFLAYAIDKRRAVHSATTSAFRGRIPERTLHLLALLGGWPGALLAARLFHHKTRKLSFRLVTWLIVTLHLALVSYLLYRVIA
jgi:uncharacterized membrane protein YsdA (DUF1294 family)